MNLSYYNGHPQRTHFERCLKRLKQEVLRMGTLVEESCRLSHQALFNQNLDAVSKITEINRQVDHYYRQIELDFATLMTLQSPVAQDLRLVSAFMQLIDLERIGYYAKDLAKIAVRLFSYPPHPIMKEAAAMSHHAQIMLGTSLVALVELDSNAGQQVKRLDDTVDDTYEKLYQTLACQRNVQEVIEPFLLLALVIRHLERMADHSTNIAQRVSYIVTG
ncbi:phosphate signaling complex protein PhoU [cyanobacterium endosymbiont of Rhopalodia gibberula]|uniref:phosphate signaling complex protein PhoU n=1 Tax=cyanobacterium endosymbiont of Rhopalodia gibberula TaxID=1763363 RepID=UPI000E647873|nr:phosphate signaling complex protein PhoU [cyanobacterium endosymbiont of Rhopalodia gibberula]